jgi:hypothetical protein
MKKIYVVLQYGIIILLLVASGTPINSLYYIQTVIALFTVTMLYYLINARAKKAFLVPKKMVVFLLYISAFFVISEVINKDVDISHYIGLAIQLCTALFIATEMEWEMFKKIFLNVISAIAFYSTVLTIYFNLNMAVVGSLPLYGVNIVSTSLWRTFYNIYFIWGWSQWSSLIRNSGCFREPGVFGVVLIIAILIKIIDINSKKEDISKNELVTLLVLIFAAITTFSTTTIICLALCIVAYFSSKKRMTEKTIALIFLCSIAGLYFIAPRLNMLFEKFDPSSTQYISYSQRLNGSYSGIDSWLQDPLFGIGFTKFNINLVDGNNANSFVDILGKYGIFVFILVFIALLSWIKAISSNNIMMFFVTIIIITCLISQNMILMPLFMVFEFYGIKRRKRLV